jgi:hypothetical protein
MILTPYGPRENKANSWGGIAPRQTDAWSLARDGYNGRKRFFRFFRAHFGRLGTPIYER